MEKVSEIRSAIDELSMVVFNKVKPGDDHSGGGGAAIDEQKHNNSISASHNAHISTKPFLAVCNLLLQVLDKIGPTMAVFRQDIHQNIQRIEKLYESEPSVYSNLVEILKKEKVEGKARTGHSCSKAFVWLTRSLHFTVTLLQLLVEDLNRNLEQAVEESYNLTLKPWHGWISSAAYKVALKLVPDTECFISLLMTKNETQDLLKEEMCTFISLCAPVLEEIHSVLKAYELDRLRCT
ncbi:OLC1v1016634C1 [Oldenlandia corymbosa var. corymbosa]|uniref:OLC1v1016634C1 n=1 Tax=Oldenlandia corymbosa var. corymbosa TaxID=529605 RepID=A0AAV1E7L7_OLDCO|nr:OLC1v1016634C1 [Oldenlandia corymbosa var. corymbosa]